MSLTSSRFPCLAILIGTVVGPPGGHAPPAVSLSLSVQCLAGVLRESVIVTATTAVETAVTPPLAGVLAVIVVVVEMRVISTAEAVSAAADIVVVVAVTLIAVTAVSFA